MYFVGFEGCKLVKFIGRDKELKRLGGLATRNIPGLIVMKGRRRIGKSRLLKEFGSHLGKFYIFSGLAPDLDKQITAQDQRDEFVHHLGIYFGLRGIKANDWSDLFWHLSEQTKNEKVLIVLDEITWMAMGDPTFLSKLKNAWDLYFTNNNHLVFAICGSISMWIEKNILSSTGFLGRESLNMTLKELPLSDCNKFWDNGVPGVSAQEKLKILAVTGGIPRYLELIDPKKSAEWNIKQLCFTKEGVLYTEFNKIFSDLFRGRKEIYESIMMTLLDKKQGAEEIRLSVGISRGGDIYSYLTDLEQAGFIGKDMSWSIKDGKTSSRSLYRLSDNYSRFYLKYIAPNKLNIESDMMEDVSLSSLPGWNAIISLQVENLILNNRKLIHEKLGLTADEVVCSGPYFQKKTKNKEGCQVDYLILTKFNVLYVCEIKFSKNPVRIDVIEEVQKKINRMKIPKHYSYRPVLIHCNEVYEAVEDSQFFAEIINFSQFLE